MLTSTYEIRLEGCGPIQSSNRVCFSITFAPPTHPFSISKRDRKKGTNHSKKDPHLMIIIKTIHSPPKQLIKRTTPMPRKRFLVKKKETKKRNQSDGKGANETRKTMLNPLEKYFENISSKLPQPHHQRMYRGAFVFLSRMGGRGGRIGEGVERGVGGVGKSWFSSSVVVMGTPDRVRGTKDVDGDESKRLRNIISTCTKWSERFGFGEEVMTPTIEKEELFRHSLGDLSDVVMKEMFAVSESDHQEQEQQQQQQQNDAMVLRPEGTMGFLRYLAQSTPRPLPFKAHYYGKMYRCESPQFGRSREFWQFGAECIDTTPSTSSSPSPSSPSPSPPPLTTTSTHDVETILLAHSIMTDLFPPSSSPSSSSPSSSSPSSPWKLLINTLGNPSDLSRFSEALGYFFEPRVALLSEDSQKRVQRKNYLRILDSKDPMDQELLNDPSFPRPRDYMSVESLERFEGIKESLNHLGIEFEEDERLVRGLDYYQETVFEFVYERGEGGLAVIAGGRYGGLGGQGGVGWAAGVSRISSILSQTAPSPLPSPPPTFVLSITSTKSNNTNTTPTTITNEALKLTHELRKRGIYALFLSGKSPQKLLKKAVGRGAGGVVFVGEKEVEEGRVGVKDVEKGKQESLEWNLDVLVEHLEGIVREKE